MTSSSSTRTLKPLEWIEHPELITKDVVTREQVTIERNWSCQCSPALRCWAWLNGDWRVEWRIGRARAGFAARGRVDGAHEGTLLVEAKQQALDAAEGVLSEALEVLEAVRLGTTRPANENAGRCKHLITYVHPVESGLTMFCSNCGTVIEHQRRG